MRQWHARTIRFFSIKRQHKPEHCVFVKLRTATLSHKIKSYHHCPYSKTFSLESVWHPTTQPAKPCCHARLLNGTTHKDNIIQTGLLPLPFITRHATSNPCRTSQQMIFCLQFPVTNPDNDARQSTKIKKCITIIKPGEKSPVFIKPDMAKSRKPMIFPEKKQLLFL